MPKHSAYIPGFLSLLLPGLGQLFEKRFLPCGLFFASFIALEFLPRFRFLVPVLALAAGLEAFLRARARRASGEPPAPGPAKARYYLYLMVGVAGSTAWFFNLAPDLLPAGKPMKVNTDVDLIAQWLWRCEANQDCGKPPIAIDPWGTEYQIRPQADNEAVEVRSAGPDRVFQTPDDYKYRYRRSMAPTNEANANAKGN